MKRKFIVYSVLAVLLGTIILFTGACGEKKVIKNPDTFIQAEIGDPDTLDPSAQYDTASAAAIELVYDTLIRFDGESTTKYKADLATEWNISADGKTYRFHIRKNVKFSNGDVMTPADVEYSFERGMVQDYSAGPQWLFFEPFFGSDSPWGASSRDADGNLVPLSELTSKVNVDGEWVQFNLATPYEPFLQILCGQWASIVDKKWCIEQGDWDGTQASYEKLNNPESDAWPMHDKMMGTGPFILEYWDQGVELSFIKNENYWGKKANFTRVIIKHVDEWTTRKIMLENGDADFAYVPVEYYSEMDGVSGLTVYRDLAAVQCEGFFFVYNISPDSPFVGSGKLDGQGIPLDFFSDINVRKAFTYSFNWTDYINEVMQGHAIQPNSPVIKGLSYYNPDLPKYSYDAAKATEFFKAAWGGQIWEKGFTMTLAYNAGNTSRKTACDILAANINALNPKFHVTSAAQQWTSYNAQWRKYLLPAFNVGWLPDYMDAHNFIVPWMASYGPFARFQAIPADVTGPIDELIARGIGSASSTERQSIYNQLAGIYYDQCFGILTMQPTVNRYFKDWVSGFVFNPAEVNDASFVYQLSKD
jgi:peptide/nickel transport system substrate-binding protein